MPKARILVASAAFALVTLSTPLVLAQVSTINFQPNLVTRIYPNGVIPTGCLAPPCPYECPGRGANVTGCIVDSTFQGIGFHDCMDDSVLRLPITIPSGLPDPTGNLQVWAGTGDCTAAGTTNNATTGTCWNVWQAQTAQNVMDIDIHVADIAGFVGITAPNLPQVFPSSVNVNTACNNSAATSVQTSTDDAGNMTTTVGEATVSIYIMWFLNGSPTPSVTVPAYAVKVKLLGPAAVSGVTVGSADSALTVNWLPPLGDTTIQGYDLYAIPNGTTLSSDAAVEASTQLETADGGACPDGDVEPELDDAGNTVTDDAGNTIYVDAGCHLAFVQDASSPTTVTCGGTIDTTGISCTGADAGASSGVCEQVNGPTNASGTITGLSNNMSYAVAVTAFDQYGNAGQVSPSQCGTPGPVIDFWKTYNQDGGNAFCALELVGKGGGTVAAGLIGMVGTRLRETAEAASSMRGALFAGAVFMVLASARPAKADESSFPKKFESKQWFAIEFRFAPYWPAIDSQPGLGNSKPYFNTFGSMPRLLFSGEFDFQALRIPHFGTLGPALSFGYTEMSAPAPEVSNPKMLSGENTNLEVFPFYLVAVLRVDVLMRDYRIPIVPYAKAGLAVTIWHAFDDTGGTSCIPSGSGQSCAFGATWGEQFALGGMLNLDWIDRRAASNLDQAAGINHTYLFAEWMFANLDNFGSSKGLRVGTDTICGGLAFEF